MSCDNHIDLKLIHKMKLALLKKTTSTIATCGSSYSPFQAVEREGTNASNTTLYNLILSTSHKVLTMKKTVATKSRVQLKVTA